MNKDQLIILAGKIIDGKASDTEIAQFNLFITSFQFNNDNEEKIVLDTAMEDELLKNIHAGLNTIEGEMADNISPVPDAVTGQKKVPAV